MSAVPQGQARSHCSSVTLPVLSTRTVLIKSGVQTVWKFDKREFGGKAPPRNLPAPPENVNNNLVRLIVAMVNEATDNIPCWDDYVATGG